MEVSYHRAREQMAVRNLTLAFAFLLMGCGDDPAAPAGRLDLRVDRSQYVVGQELELTLTNGTRRDVYVAFECGTLLQGRRAGDWEVVYEYFCRDPRTVAPDFYADEIRPGRSLSGRLTVRLRLSHDPSRFEDFRLVTMVKDQPAARDRVQVVSPTFLVLPPSQNAASGS